MKDKFVSEMHNDPEYDEMMRKWALEQAVNWTARDDVRETKTLEKIADAFIKYVVTPR